MPDLEKVVEVFEDADADLVEVFEEAVEDGHQVGRRQLVSQDHCQLVDGEGQRSTHLPLVEVQKMCWTIIHPSYQSQKYPYGKMANSFTF